jgi:hypothetical protein
MMPLLKECMVVVVSFIFEIFTASYLSFEKDWTAWANEADKA